ncbi:MAG: fumarylacetoacetate hydrolase family protein [Aliishimia sp.]
MTPLFAPMPAPMIPVIGEDTGFPVHRIFCVGRNYEAHAKEMGGEVDREAPWYFTKSPAHVCLSGSVVPFPQGTSNYHHEMEMAVYLGADSDIIGYGSALDMTRRDRQQDGKDNRRPWSLGKDVENAAVLTPITRGFAVDGQRIWLSVNGEMRQDATLTELVWSVPEVINHLSQFYHLGAGDVILTGTPAGVGPVVAGDKIEGGVDGLETVSLTLTA